MSKKWKYYFELERHILKDSTLSSIPNEDIKDCGYAGHAGYTSRLIKYKHIFVILCDIGNGHYSLCSIASYFDLIIVKLMGLADRLRRF